MPLPSLKNIGLGFLGEDKDILPPWQTIKPETKKLPSLKTEIPFAWEAEEMARTKEVGQIKTSIESSLSKAKSEFETMPGRKIAVPLAGPAKLIAEAFPEVKEAETKRSEIRNLELTLDLYNDLLAQEDKSLMDEFYEGLTDPLKEPEKALPFARYGFSLDESLQVIKAAKKAEEGEELTSYETSLIEKARAQQLPIDRSWSYFVGRVISEMPTYMAEFAGLKSLVAEPVTAITKTILGEGATVAVPSIVQKLWKAPAEIGINALISNAVGVAVQAGTFAATQLPSDIAEKSLPYQKELQSPLFPEIYESLGKDFNWKKEMVKSFGSSFVEVITEYAGSIVGNPIEYLSKATLGKWLAKRGISMSSKALEELAEQISWNGIIGEVFEEELAELLQAPIEEREYKAPWTPEGMERLLVETLGIAPFGGIGAVSSLTTFAKEQYDKLTPEERQRGSIQFGEEEVSKELIEEAKKYKSAEEFVMAQKPINVSIKDILPTEGHTAENTIKLRKPKKDVLTEPIRVEINKQGKIQIQDGNHRFFQAIEKGDKTIPIVFNDQAPLLNFEGEFDRIKDFYNKAQEVKPKEKVVKPPSVKKLLGIPVSKKITMRETTLLKERFKNLARGARTGVIVTKQQIKAVQSELVDFIDKSELELKDKAKFRRVIKNIQTPEQLQSKLPEIQERIVSLAESSEIRRLKTDIKKELKAVKPKIVAGKPIGKFTADVQRVLDSTRGAIGLTQIQAEEKIDSNLEKYKLKPMPAEIALQNRILSMSSRDAKSLRSLLGMIRKMKETGDVASSLRKFNIQEDLDRKKKYIIDVVTDYKGIVKGRETVGRARMTWRRKMIHSLRSLGNDFVLSWPGLMRILDRHTPVDKKTLNKRFSVLDQDNKQKELQESYINDFNRMFAEIYDIPNQTTKDSLMLPLRIGDEIGKLKKEINLGTFINNVGTKIELKMTKDEMIKRYMEFKDPTLEQSFLQGNYYTNEIKDAITSTLTKQEIRLANMQLNLYRKQHEKINPLYQEMFGVDLPFNEFYSPIMREGYQVDTKQGFEVLLDEANYRRGVTSKSFISRRKNILPIAKQGSLYALDRHITDTNYFIAWAKKVRELDNIFSDPKVRESIDQEFGNKLLREIQNSIDDIGFNRRTRGQLHGAVDWFRKKFTIGVLMLKPALAAKQFTATLAYLEDVTPVEFASGFVDFWKNPIKNYKIMAKESVFIRTRGTQGNIERDIKAAMKTEVYDRFSKVNSFINMAMMNIMLGDLGSITTGSWIMRRVALKKGLSLSEAVSEYEEFGSETQQSSDISRLTAFQKGGSLETLFSMFKSNPAQYLAKELNAVSSLFQKGGTTPANLKKVAKTLFIYHILLPLVFQWVSNFGGWADEDNEEYRRAMIFGSLNGLFIFGDMLDWALRKALGMRVYEIGIPINQAIQEVGNVLSKIDFDDITAEDMKDALGEMVMASENFGVPAKYLLRLPKAVQKLLEQDWREGIGLMLGWSEYMLGMKRKRGKKGIPGMPSLKMGDVLKKESLKMELPSLKMR